MKNFESYKKKEKYWVFVMSTIFWRFSPKINFYCINGCTYFKVKTAIFRQKYF
jgi:hypothetical protein